MSPPPVPVTGPPEAGIVPSLNASLSSSAVMLKVLPPELSVMVPPKMAWFAGTGGSANFKTARRSPTT